VSGQPLESIMSLVLQKLKEQVSKIGHGTGIVFHNNKNLKFMMKRFVMNLILILNIMISLSSKK
jgi:hypothetical protein